MRACTLYPTAALRLCFSFPDVQLGVMLWYKPYRMHTAVGPRWRIVALTLAHRCRTCVSSCLLAPTCRHLPRAAPRGWFRRVQVHYPTVPPLPTRLAPCEVLRCICPCARDMRPHVHALSCTALTWSTHLVVRCPIARVGAAAAMTAPANPLVSSHGELGICRQARVCQRTSRCDSRRARPALQHPILPCRFQWPCLTCSAAHWRGQTASLAQDTI